MRQKRDKLESSHARPRNLRFAPWPPSKPYLLLSRFLAFSLCGSGMEGAKRAALQQAALTLEPSCNACNAGAASLELSSKWRKLSLFKHVLKITIKQREKQMRTNCDKQASGREKTARKGRRRRKREKSDTTPTSHPLAMLRRHAAATREGARVTSPSRV